MKSLILATAAILALAAGPAFAGTAAQAQYAMSNTSQAQSGSTVIHSGTYNPLYPVPQGG